MMKHPGSPDVKVIFGLSLMHFMGDLYFSFIHPLFPVFVEKFSLTLTQVGLLAGITRLLAFVVQPPVGYLADYYRTRFFVLGGPLLAIVFIPLVGIAPCFFALILFVSLGSIGAAMFHPTLAGMVSAYSGRHLGLSMSIYNGGGTLAFGLGPLFITYLVSSYGLGVSPFTMILGLAAMVPLFRIIPPPQGEGLKDLGFIRSIKEVLGTVWKALVLLWVILVLRAFVGQSFLTFVPVLYAKEGYSLVSIGMMVSLFTVSGAISGLLAGHLSDRVGYKPVFCVAYGLTTPSLFLLLYLPANWVYVGAVLGGFFSLATLPLGVAMAQELAPRGKSMVSSFMMGLTFGLGGMMTLLTGRLADIFSIRAVLVSLAVIPFLKIGLVGLLPGKKVTYHGPVV